MCDSCKRRRAAAGAPAAFTARGVAPSRAMRAAALLWWCCVPATGLVAGRRPSPRRAVRRAAAAERLTFTFADLYPTGFAAAARDRCSLFLRRGDGRAVDATFTARLVGDGVAVDSRSGRSTRSSRAERPWPATLPEAAVPLALAPASYTALTAASAVGGALAILGSAALAAAVFVSLSVVPTRSMEPGIAPGDVLLVEKTSALLRRPPKAGEVVLFAPPPPLRAIAKIADDRALYPDARAAPGRLARARREGLAPAAEFAPEGRDLRPRRLRDASVDSRVWGPLDAAAVRARPVATVYRRGR
ncbi:serine-type peptidase [Aureococcus anophagefferens]|nr:serine-type peptidase [Aureococcus anophagefferens]